MKDGFDYSAYVADLERIVNVDSGRGYGEGAEKVADFFLEKYRSLGLIAEKKYGADPSAPFVTARNRPDGRIQLLLVAHMDTVFAPGTAKERPFRPDEKGNFRGPGVVDCKAGCLLIYYLVKRLTRDGDPGFSFCVAMNSDEERGSLSSRAFFEELADVSDRCFLFEPGRPREEFVIQRKGGGNYRVRCHGIPAHSGVDPEKGASAVLELSRTVADLYDRFFRPEEGTTVNVGRFSGGGEGGSVPDFAEFSLSMRALSDEKIKEADGYINSLPDHPHDPRCRIEVEKRPNRPPMYPGPEALELRRLFERVGERLSQPVEMLVTGGGSDGNFISPHGCPVIDGCGPCGGALHTEDEYLIPGSIKRRYDFMLEAISELFNV